MGNINVTIASATGTLWPVRDIPAIFFHISHWYHLHTLACKRILSCDLWWTRQMPQHIGDCATSRGQLSPFKWRWTSNHTHSYKHHEVELWWWLPSIPLLQGSSGWGPPCLRCRARGRALTCQSSWNGSEQQNQPQGSQVKYEEFETRNPSWFSTTSFWSLSWLPLLNMITWSIASLRLTSTLLRR